jgi:archaellum biogenesis protein FlaJ (TadC family)
MRTLFITLCFSLGILVLLFEEHVLPSGFIPSNPSTDYVMSLVSLVVTLGGVFFAMQVTKKEKQDKTFTEGDDEAKRRAYLKWNGRRMGIIFSAVFTNLIIYYGGTFNESAMYSFIITLIGAIFCWPSKQ